MPTKAKNDAGPRVPEAARPIYEAVTSLTDPFCESHLNGEYRDLAREAVAALARKRPCPLGRGHVDTWAAGILYALGSHNFLHDPAQKPHMKLYDLCEILNVAPSTGAAKAKEVRRLLKIANFDHKWLLPSMVEESPTAWLIQVNGYILDARQLPRDIQDAAFAKGLIPYVPDDRHAHDQ